jgi:hypothetical protein
MQLIRFGYDKEAGVYQRGYARPDWSLSALEDHRGYGWQINDRWGNLSPYMSLKAAKKILLEE